jgi:hypothetical protein
LRVRFRRKNQEKISVHEFLISRFNSGQVDVLDLAWPWAGYVFKADHPSSGKGRDDIIEEY